MPKRQKWADVIAETPVPEAFSLPGPYRIEGGSILAADGAPLVGWCWGGNMKRQLVAANRDADIRAALEALAAAAERGIDLAATIDRDFGPSPEAIAGAARSRNGSASLANADPHKAFSLSPGALEKHRGDRNAGVYDWTRRGEFCAHTFPTLGDALLLTDALDRLARLDAAVLRLKAEPRAALGDPLAAALDRAEALMRTTLNGTDEEVRYNTAIRKVSPDRPYGPNGFLNPYYEGLGNDMTWMRTADVHDPDANTRRHSLGFSWLTWQGSEWRVDFPSRGARDAAADAIFHRFATDADKAIYRRNARDAAREQGYDWNHEAWHRVLSRIEDRQKSVNKGEFWRDGVTVRPDMVADLLPADAVIHFTPTSLEARRQMVKLGADCFFGKAVSASPAEIPVLLANPVPDPMIAIEARAEEERRAAEEAKAKQPVVLFRSAKFVVTDHREQGVEVTFRTIDASGDAQGAKWFVDAAGDQVRAFFHGDRTLRGKMVKALEDRLAQRLDITPYPLR